MDKADLKKLPKEERKDYRDYMDAKKLAGYNTEFVHSINGTTGSEWVWSENKALIFRAIDGWLDNYEPLAVEYDEKKNKGEHKRLGRFNSVVVRRLSKMGDKKGGLFDEL